MRSKVRRWGNSLAVRIPHTLARELHLKDGESVELSLNEHRLVITPAPSSDDLDQLIAGITMENRHSESEWGSPMGAEAW